MLSKILRPFRHFEDLPTLLWQLHFIHKYVRKNIQNLDPPVLYVLRFKLNSPPLHAYAESTLQTKKSTYIGKQIIVYCELHHFQSNSKIFVCIMKVNLHFISIIETII